jgi:hypothetical protein
MRGRGPLLARRRPTPLGLPGEYPRLGRIQVVAWAIGICLGQAVGLLVPLAPANALPVPTKKPCRWHCERQWQGDGIHRRVAGNVLHSNVSSLPTGFFVQSGTQQLYLMFVAQAKSFVSAPQNTTNFAAAPTGPSTHSHQRPSRRD